MDLVAPPLDPLPQQQQPQQYQHRHVAIPPQFQEELPICYTNNPKVVEEWIRHHVPPKTFCLGFDIEAVPFRTAHPALKTAAVVQMATPSHAIVVQLAKASNKPSADCLDVLQYMVLENDRILKAGCGIEDDMANLFHLYEGVGCSLLQANSRLELGGVGSSHVGHTVGLKTLTGRVLGLDLPKPKRIIRSHWGRVPLSQTQVTYGARDAWAACAIVHELARMDPRCFNVEDMRQRLRVSQPTVRDLVWRRHKRKQAKAMMRFIRQARAHGALNHAQEMQWLQELKRIRRDNRHIHPQQYPLSLGTKGAESRSKTKNLSIHHFNHTDAGLIY